MNSPIIFDIETIPDRLTEYNQAFPKSKKKAGIHAIISRVVAVGYDLGGYRKVIMGEEEEILGEFADLLNEHRTATLVGFNVKNFDIPLLQLRAARYGIKLCLPDRRSQRICDLFDILGGKWQTDVSACSLSELHWFLYGAGKQSNGCDIAKMWEDHDLEGIRAHCAEDCQITFDIYNDFKGVLW
jgi:predicted PolB exonuclease-like 3'-5' exonuclease